MSVTFNTCSPYIHIRAAKKDQPGIKKYIPKPIITLIDKHNRRIIQYGTVLVNIGKLAAKIFKDFPKIIGQVSMALYRYLGIIWVVDLARGTIKSALEARFSFEIKDKIGILLTTLKTTIRGTDTLLTCGMFAAAVVALFGAPGVTLAMYAVMRIPAIISYLIGIGLTISDYYQNRSLIQLAERIKAGKEPDIRIERVVQHFKGLLEPSKRGDDKAVTRREKRLATRYFRQLHFGKLKEMREKLPTIANPEQLYKELNASIPESQTITVWGLLLTIFNYIGLGVGKWYPDTIASNSFELASSLFWTGKLEYEFYTIRNTNERLTTNPKTQQNASS